MRKSMTEEEAAVITAFLSKFRDYDIEIVANKARERKLPWFLWRQDTGDKIDLLEMLGIHSKHINHLRKVAEWLEQRFYKSGMTMDKKYAFPVIPSNIIPIADAMKLLCFKTSEGIADKNLFLNNSNKEPQQPYFIVGTQIREYSSTACIEDILKTLADRKRCGYYIYYEPNGMLTMQEIIFAKLFHDHSPHDLASLYSESDSLPTKDSIPCIGLENWREQKRWWLHQLPSDSISLRFAFCEFRFDGFRFN